MSYENTWLNLFTAAVLGGGALPLGWEDVG